MGSGWLRGPDGIPSCARSQPRFCVSCLNCCRHFREAENQIDALGFVQLSFAFACRRNWRPWARRRSMAIPYLLPFSKQLQLTWSGQWALNAWQNFVITAVLIAIAVALARRRGFSPLEMFSPKADSVFVGALRARFPVNTAS